MTKKPEEVVKLQIPVSRELADELARWAKKMEYTQAHLCKVLLDFAMDDMEKIGEWLSIRAIGKRKKGIRKGWLQQGNSSEVRLQVPIPAKLAARLEELADRLNHTTVRMAALLIDFSLVDQEWGMRFVSTRLGKAVLSIFGKPPHPYESAEIAVVDGDL